MKARKISIDFLNEDFFCLFNCDKTGKSDKITNIELMEKYKYCVCCDNVGASILDFVNDNSQTKLIECMNEGNPYYFDQNINLPVPSIDHLTQINGFYSDDISNYGKNPLN